MRLTKLGHSCLLVTEGSARLLIDPGVLSDGFEELEGLTAVLFTHQHSDHFDAGRLRELLERNQGVRVVSDEGTAGPLSEIGVDAQVVRDGNEFELGGVSVRVVGREHAVIHPDIPVVPNVGYLVAGRLFHPGDAFTRPGQPVDFLAVPAGAPWLKVSEAIDYIREVRPTVAVPVHDKVLSAAGRSIHFHQLERLGGIGSGFQALDDGESAEL